MFKNPKFWLAVSLLVNVLQTFALTGQVPPELIAQLIVAILSLFGIGALMVAGVVKVSPTKIKEWFER